MKLTHKELLEKVEYIETETKHFMPNEVFEDLQNNIEKSPHVAFAYSYYYLTSWLYRNAKYGHIDIDVGTIKEILGYSKTNKTMNYIIKKNGVLDEMGYTTTTTDYPVSWEVDDYNSPIFKLKSELEDDEINKTIRMRSSRFTVKYPIKHMHIDDYDYNTKAHTGIFYEVSNTHRIDFEVFSECMTNKDLGTTGFYLYSYLKNKNQMFPDGYDVSLEALSKETGISNGSLATYLDGLKKYNLVSVKHNMEYFAYGMLEEDRKANTYRTNDYVSFSNKPIDYIKMKMVSNERYLIDKERIKRNINQDDIPFLF